MSNRWHDMHFEAPRTQIADIPKRLAVPQFINIVAGGLTPMIGLDELEKMGFAMVLYANAALQASIAGTAEGARPSSKRAARSTSVQFAGFEERSGWCPSRVST